MVGACEQRGHKVGATMLGLRAWKASGGGGWARRAANTGHAIVHRRRGATSRQCTRAGPQSTPAADAPLPTPTPAPTSATRAAGRETMGCVRGWEHTACARGCENQQPRARELRESAPTVGNPVVHCKTTPAPPRTNDRKANRNVLRQHHCVCRLVGKRWRGGDEKERHGAKNPDRDSAAAAATELQRRKQRRPSTPRRACAIPPMHVGRDGGHRQRRRRLKRNCFRRPTRLF